MELQKEDLKVLQDLREPVLNALGVLEKIPGVYGKYDDEFLRDSVKPLFQALSSPFFFEQEMEEMLDAIELTMLYNIENENALEFDDIEEIEIELSRYNLLIYKLDEIKKLYKEYMKLVKKKK